VVQQAQLKSGECEKLRSNLNGNSALDIEPINDRFGEMMTKLEQLLATLGRESNVRTLSPSGTSSESETSLIRRPRTATPDPRWIKSIIRARNLRARFFNADLFADPAWDMTSKIFEKSIYTNAMH